MHTRRQIAIMSALSSEQEAILNGFRNLPAHAGVLAANYQKAAEVENVRRHTEHAEEIASLRSEFAVQINELSDSLKKEISSIRKIENQNQYVFVQLEKDIQDLKTSKPTIGEFLAVIVVLSAFVLMYAYKPATGN